MEFDSAGYWRKRYESGGNSGAGSYGALADFKATALNHFVTQYGIESAVEYGSGDGNQLSLLRIPAYIGLDVSARAISDIRLRYQDDSSKSFIEYDPDDFLADQSVSADIALSMDVILHLTEDIRFEKYMKNLVASSRRYVGIFNTATEEQLEKMAQHNRFRDHRIWMKSSAPEFTEVEVALTPPKLGYPIATGFYFYERL
jgi:hypothetical protein